nr:YTH domain-containing protein 1 [Ipomoea trifida]
MSSGGVKKGPPKHQNRFAWKPNAGKKINETEPGGRFRPLSEITGVCLRCKEQIDWKRKYGKYKPLAEPAKCQKCSKRNVRQAYHNICTACAKEHNVCAKCSCRVDRIVGRDLSEIEAEKKALEEAIKNARERDRRSLLRAMNKGKSHSSTKSQSQNEKVGELVPGESTQDDDDANISTQNDEKVVELASSLKQYAKFNEEEEEEDDDDDDEEEEELEDHADKDDYVEEETGRGRE